MSGSWQDRRFMWQAGKEVHQGSTRRMSGSSADTTSPVLINATPAAEAGTTPALPEYPTVEKKVLSNPDAWGGNRIYSGMSGREVHEPSRKMSGSSDTKPVVPKSSSPPASGGGGVAGAIAGRRRSSASQGGVFSGLMANRTSQDAKRQNWSDAHKGEGIGGFLSNLVNTKPADKK